MNIKNTFAAFASVAIAGLFVLGGALAIDAQGRYVGQYSRNDVSNIIRQMEENSDEFRTDFRRELNDSNLNSSTRNRYNGFVANMENAIDDLRRHFDRNDNWWLSRSRVQTVISRSQNVNTMMRSLPFERQLERQWNQLRRQINRVADTYDLAGLDGGGWGGGPWNPGNPGGINRPPQWLVGTWYWTGGDRRMTIAANGNITVYNQGRQGRGEYRNGTLVFDGIVSNVSQYGGGIRTYNTQSGELSDYTRWQGGGGGGGGWGGNVSRPPNWAIGNWRWVQGSGRTMSIYASGEVVVVNQGRYSRGTYNNGSITLDGITSTLRQNGRNRIRTYNTQSGEVSDYSRQ
jgi:hypothetical protein